MFISKYNVIVIILNLYIIRWNTVHHFVKKYVFQYTLIFKEASVGSDIRKTPYNVKLYVLCPSRLVTVYSETPRIVCCTTGHNVTSGKRFISIKMTGTCFSLA